MKLFLLVLLLGVAVAVDDDKIINGYECQPHSQPWQVYFTTNGYRWCGGSVINEWWVLSAAHCEQPADTLVAHIGEHNTDVDEGTEQHIVASKVISHPAYDAWTVDNDIMLVKLSKPVQFNNYVGPIEPSAVCPTAGLQCLVSGWGNLLNNGGVQYPPKLQCLDIPVLTDNTCQQSYPGQISKNMFCAGFIEGGKDACQGDSGGPVVCGEKLEGIVSWGAGCAMRNYPGVYTKVCNYISWIRSTMGSN
ncbi:trypsin-3-like [Heterodontus francisci]|uniref:trypsin-3-like n=1 Tax=Heterodontus francisci TaxID=7792 RepID=UPI00355B76B1